MALLKVGDKVRLCEGIPISNEELSAGLHGTVVEIIMKRWRDSTSFVMERVTVKLDVHTDMLDEWQKCIHLDLDNWCDEPSVEALVMRMLEKLPSKMVKEAMMGAERALHMELSNAMCDWREAQDKEGRLTPSELDDIVRSVIEDYQHDYLSPKQ